MWCTFSQKPKPASKGGGSRTEIKKRVHSSSGQTHKHGAASSKKPLPRASEPSNANQHKDTNKHSYPTSNKDSNEGVAMGGAKKIIKLKTAKATPATEGMNGVWE